MKKILTIMLVLFTANANALIIKSYTAYYEDNSKLVVDLKNRNYAPGTYFASATEVDEGYVQKEGFDALFFPANPAIAPNFPKNPIGIGSMGHGLHFTVDDLGGVQMDSLFYLGQAPDWVMSQNFFTIQLFEYHSLAFTGGYFTVTEPNSIALLGLGLFGLVAARRKMGS